VLVRGSKYQYSCLQPTDSVALMTFVRRPTAVIRERRGATSRPLRFCRGHHVVAGQPQSRVLSTVRPKLLFGVQNLDADQGSDAV
jgi:hypothetical protein